MNNEEKNIQAEQPEELKKTTFADWWNKLASAAKAAIIGAVAAVVILPLVIVLALGGSSAENDDTDGGAGDDNAIVITVVDDKGNAVKDVELQFVTAKMPLPQKFKTDADGKVTTTNKDVIKVKITNIPDGYSFADLNKELKIPADGKLTVTIEKHPEWVIKVVDQDGNGVAGVQVTMCVAEGENAVCKLPIETDENGCASYISEPGTYQAKINSAVDGYDAPVGEYLPFDGYEVVIEITKLAN